MVAKVTTQPSQGATKTTWTGLSTSDRNGDAADLNGARFVTIQLKGNFSGTPTVNIQGSNDGGTTWANLKGLDHTEIGATGAAIVEIEAHPLQVRPSLSSGDASTDIDVIMSVRHG